MIVGILFTIFRFIELFFLIPPLGMLSYIVHEFVSANELTPEYVLVLFITVVLASVWALGTVLFYGSVKHNGYFIALIDMGLFGALIAGVVEVRHCTDGNCTSPTSSIGIQSGIFLNDLSKYCSLLKASFAFGIIEIILFFNTFFLALWVHHHHRKDDRGEKSYRDEKSSKRRRRRSGSQVSRRSGDYPRSRSRGAPRSRSRGPSQGPPPNRYRSQSRSVV